MKRVLFIGWLSMSLLGLTVGSCIAASPSPSQGPITKLRLAHTMPEGSDVGIALKWWADELTKRSKEAVKVEVYPMSVLVKLPQMLEAVKTGVADIGVLSVESYAKFFPLTTVMMLPTIHFPYSEKGMVASGKAFMELYNRYPVFQTAYTDVRLLLLPGLDIQNIVSKKELRVPNDLKGMKIGASGARLKIISACGGVPVGVVPPDAYLSLDKGVIEGIFTNWSIVAARRFQEVTSYYLDYQLTSLALPMIMNVDSWNSLPSDIKKIISGLSMEALNVRAKEHMATADNGMKQWGVAGRKVTTLTAEERKLWDQKCEPFVEEWITSMEANGVKEARQILVDLKNLEAVSWK